MLKQSWFLIWRRNCPMNKPNHAISLLFLCYLLLFFSSCANPLLSGFDAATIEHPTPTITKVTITPTQKDNKTDSNIENPLKVQLAKVQQIMAGMTLDQKLGQLFIVEYLGNSYTGTELQYMVAKQYVGGFLYQESNHNFDPPYNSISSVANFSQQSMSDAQIPLLIGTDQEGGLVNRLYVFHGYLPSAAQMAATGKPQIAYNQGAMAAKWMKQLGINADLAPVVDVHI